MKIWEAILYAIMGGLTELLPVSFVGHSLILQNAFHMSPISSADGSYIRAAICLGLVISLYMSFYHEAKDTKIVLRRIRSPRRQSVNREKTQLKLRVILLSIFALIPMLLSFLFLRKAEGMNKLTIVSLLFALNGAIIFFCTRGTVGKREEREVTLFDTLLIGLIRMICVFPGLSGVGASLCIGRARGLSDRFNIRITYLLTLVFQIVACVFYLFCGILYGEFTGRTVLSCLFSVVISAAISYFALLYFRNMMQKNRLKSFVYYCIDVAAIAFIIAIING